MSANWLYTANQSSQSEQLLHELIKFEQNWQHEFLLSDIELQLKQHLAFLSDLPLPEGNESDRFYATLDAIFDELAFSGPGLQSIPESSLSNVSYCVMHRTGSYLSMSVVINYLLQQLGYHAFIAEVEGQLGLVVKLSNSELIIIDALSGGCEYLISSDDVRESLTNEIATFAQIIPTDELIKILLTEQKLNMLEEGFLEEAFNCVETLMQLLPEDPYERRDRGLVLQQLECDQWAVEDFDYFIKACPNDPMAMFLKHQIDDLNGLHETIH
jgi:regulator of sirC expression with transglutaminase-like and TPR domain